MTHNWSEEKYPDQRLYLIERNRYTCVVPSVVNEADEEITLKIIYPNRHFTKRYLGRRNADDRR